MELPVQPQEPPPDDPPSPSCDLVVFGVSAVDDLVVDLVVVGAFVTVGPAPPKIPLLISVTYSGFFLIDSLSVS